MNAGRERKTNILKLVSASPEAAASKDRKRWLSLFADNAWIEDPAGSRRYFSMETEWSLAAFYDIFIRNSAFRFDIVEDYISGNEVLRDGSIAVGIPNGGSINIPAYLHYEVSEDDRISGLRAYWGPFSAVVSASREGSGGAEYLMNLARRIHVAIGLRGLRGFLGGAGLTFPVSRITTFRLKHFLETGRFFEATMLFGDLGDKEIRICHESGVVSVPANYLTTGELKIRDISNLVTAGRSVVFRLSLLLKGETRSGVAILAFHRAGLRIQKIDIFLRG